MEEPKGKAIIQVFGNFHTGFGAEVKPCKYVKIAPNFRYIDPKADGVKAKCMAYINCYFGF